MRDGVHNVNIVNDLSGDIPGMVARRRFLGLLGAGLAAAAFPGETVAGTADRPARAGPLGPPEGWRPESWPFEDPPTIQDPEAVQLDQNENPLAPSMEGRRALADAIDLANRYPDAEGRLVRKLAARHGVEPENILMGCGSTELLKVCADAFMRKGGSLIQAAPTYPTVERYTRVHGSEVISVPVDGQGWADVEGMLGRLSSRTRLVYLCNPNNPTGRIIPASDLEEVLYRAESMGVPVAVDEAYHHFVDHPEYESLLSRAAERPGLVVLRTFSKVFGLAGMRIGYAVAHSETMKALLPWRLVINLNNPAIFAAMAALDDVVLREKTVKMNREARDSLVHQMSRFGGHPIPSQAGFVWVDFGRPTRPIREALAEHHVYVRTYRHSPEHLRISTGTPDQLAALYEAFQEVVGG